MRVLSMVAVLALAAPVQAAELIPYTGTSAADKIDFRFAQKPYKIVGLAGNDLIQAGTKNDVIYGDAGRDTIDSWFGNDVVRGGSGGDYFRYMVIEVHEEGTHISPSGFDTICDFGSGDKLDVYNYYLGSTGGGDNVATGGNFAKFDSNKDGKIDKLDSLASIKNVSTCGKSKPSLVLNTSKLFNANEGAGSLTIYGKTSLSKSQFVADYRRVVEDY